MGRLGALFVVCLFLSSIVSPPPAHASAKKVAGVALVVAGGFLVAGGVILYAVRYTGEDVGSAAPGVIVGGAGIASIVTGAVILSSGKPEQKKSALRLTPIHHGIALAYVF